MTYSVTRNIFGLFIKWTRIGVSETQNFKGALSFRKIKKHIYLFELMLIAGFILYNSVKEINTHSKLKSCIL